MKKIAFIFILTVILSGCTINRDRNAETQVTDNAHNFIEQIFNARW